MTNKGDGVVSWFFDTENCPYRYVVAIQDEPTSCRHLTGWLLENVGARGSYVYSESRWGNEPNTKWAMKFGLDCVYFGFREQHDAVMFRLRWQ